MIRLITPWVFHPQVIGSNGPPSVAVSNTLSQPAGPGRSCPYCVRRRLLNFYQSGALVR